MDADNWHPIGWILYFFPHMDKCKITSIYIYVIIYGCTFVCSHVRTDIDRGRMDDRLTDGWGGLVFVIHVSLLFWSILFRIPRVTEDRCVVLQPERRFSGFFIRAGKEEGLYPYEPFAHTYYLNTCTWLVWQGALRSFLSSIFVLELD